MENSANTPARCEVCGNPPPPGHRICDDCWPNRAIETGRAAVCAICNRPRLVEKLVRQADGQWLCAEHSGTASTETLLDK